MNLEPSIRNGRILNVKVSLKNASKIRRRVRIDNILVSDINVNGKNFSEVKLYENKEKTVPLVPEFFWSVFAFFLFHEHVKTVFSVMPERCMPDVVS